MKILLHDETPAYLAQGGKQVHAQNMYESLRLLGINVEYSRWWDPGQKVDLIHMFGYSPSMVRMAREAGVKIILTHIVDFLANSLLSKRIYLRYRNYMIRRFLPSSVIRLVPWYVLPSFDALVYMNRYDAEIAIDVYGVPREKTKIIPHGCGADEIDQLQTGHRNEHSYLISIGSIIPRKNTILLAKAAKQACVPVMFLGKPISENSEYYKEFLRLVDNKYVLYSGYVSEESKIEFLKKASGFVLLSSAESGCIAVHEASAAGLPMLLSNLPWALSYGKNEHIEYVRLNQINKISERLHAFYSVSKRLESFTFPISTWKNIAAQYIDVYKKVLMQTF